MRWSCADRPHLVKHDTHTAFGELPGGLATCEAAAHDVYYLSCRTVFATIAAQRARHAGMIAYLERERGAATAAR